MIRPLAAAAVLHGIPRLLIEDDAEEEDKGTLVFGRQRRAEGQESDRNQPVRLISEGTGGLTCTQLNPANR